MNNEYARGQVVEVRVRRAGQADWWRKATVLVSTGRGADVRFFDDTDNRRCHILFNDLRAIPPERALLPPGRVAKIGTPLLTAADIDRLNAEHTRKQQQQEFAPVVQIKPPASAPAEPSKPTRRMAAPRTTQMHSPSLLGSMLRRARMERAWSQKACAQKLGVSNQVVSTLELGRVRASDEQLLKYEELLGLDLELMIKLRDTRFEDLAEPQPERIARAAPVPEPAVAEPLPTKPEAPAPTERDTSVYAFVEFCAKLQELVPVPDRTKLAEWNRLAAALWSLR